MSRRLVVLTDLDDRDDNSAEREEVARLACQGEALAALEEFAELGDRMAANAGDILESLNEAYTLIVDSGRRFSREDFALFFLAQMHGCAEDEATGRSLRAGALRYLREKRTRLAPDLAALVEETRPAPVAVLPPNPDRLLTAFEDLGRQMRAQPAPEPAPLPEEDRTEERDRLRARRLRAVEALRAGEARRRARLFWAMSGVTASLLCAMWILSLA